MASDRSNWGSADTLYGSQVSGTSKRDERRLVDVEYESEQPITVAWTGSIQVLPDPQSGLLPLASTLHPKVRVEFGTGSVVTTYDFDAVPGGTISLAANSATVTMHWDVQSLGIVEAGPILVLQDLYSFLGDYWAAMVFSCKATAHPGYSATQAIHSLWVPNNSAPSVSSVTLGVPFGAREFTFVSTTDDGSTTNPAAPISVVGSNGVKSNGIELASNDSYYGPAALTNVTRFGVGLPVSSRYLSVVPPAFGENCAIVYSF